MSTSGSGGHQERAPASPAASPAVTLPAASASASQPPSRTSEHERSELRRRRDALAEEVAELHWDLGGLAYEMAIRDHFRLDVLVRRAAVLQERDAELAELERMLQMQEGGIAGSCPQCAAPHSRGAAFCWQCGAALLERKHSDALSAPEDSSTAVMDALLAPDSNAARQAFGADADK